MGQRYDVIVTADQAAVASDFWLRAIPDTYCSNNYNPDLIKGIIHYGGKYPALHSSLVLTKTSYRQLCNAYDHCLHHNRERLSW